MYLVCPLLSLILCQIIKFTVEAVKTKNFNITRLFSGSGGMPSSHVSFISSLMFYIGFSQGFNTPIFALSLVLTFIIAYDAMGVRRETERQAVLINKLTENLYKLKEDIGHEFVEIIGGFILGFIVALFCMSF